MRLGCVRIDPERISVTADRRAKFPLLLENGPEVEVRLGILRSDRERSADEIDGERMISPLVGENSREMQSRRVAGFGPQNLLNQGFSLGQIPCLVLRERGLQNPRCVRSPLRARVVLPLAAVLVFPAAAAGAGVIAASLPVHPMNVPIAQINAYLHPTITQNRLFRQQPFPTRFI